MASYYLCFLHNFFSLLKWSSSGLCIEILLVDPMFFEVLIGGYRSEPCYQSLYFLPCFLQLVAGHWGEALFALPTLTFKRPKSIYISCVKAPQTIGGGLLERVAMKKRPDNRCLSNFVQECLSQSGVALVSSLSDDELTFSFGGLGFFDLIIHRLHGAVVEYIAP
ncbi:hypothetical protein F5879DRAFT_47149 [Lentinula edodes]|nr:hypothetical protein F5879DRAFT_47149 [Lentinula edodes]